MSGIPLPNPTPMLVGVAPGGYQRRRPLPKGSHPKSFRIERKKLWQHYELRYQNGDRFFVNLPGLMPGGADLTFHNGPYKGSPITAECHLEGKGASDDMRVRLRELVYSPAQKRARKGEWQDVRFDGERGGWKLELPIRSRDVDEKEKEETNDEKVKKDWVPYVWRKGPPPYRKDTEADECDVRNLELVSEGTGERSAVLKNIYGDVGGDEGAELEIEVDEGEDFVKLVCLTATALYEKARRGKGRGSKGDAFL